MKYLTNILTLLSLARFYIFNHFVYHCFELNEKIEIRALIEYKIYLMLNAWMIITHSRKGQRVMPFGQINLL